MKYQLISVIAILLASGCVQFSSFFGQDVLTINRKVSEEGFKDIVVIKEATSIPKSPVLPGQEILFSLIVENADKTESANNVVVDLFNAPLFKAKDKTLCNLAACLPNICKRNEPCSVLPGEQRSVEFGLLAPTEEEIARIKTDTELSYKASYDFKGSLLYSVPVINQDEIRSLQRQGKSVALSEQVSHGSGPVQIDVEIFGTPYLLSDFQGIFIFNIKNKGKGNVANSNITKRKLKIEFPVALFADGATITTPDGAEYSQNGILTKRPSDSKEPFFKCERAGAETIIREAAEQITLSPRLVCTNNEDISLFRGETRTTLRFQISKVVKITEPFKTYLIRAFVDYNYELRDTFPITIRPFEK